MEIIRTKRTKVWSYFTWEEMLVKLKCFCVLIKCYLSDNDNWNYLVVFGCWNWQTFNNTPTERIFDWNLAVKSDVDFENTLLRKAGNSHEVIWLIIFKASVDKYYPVNKGCHAVAPQAPIVILTVQTKIMKRPSASYII